MDRDGEGRANFFLFFFYTMLMALFPSLLHFLSPPQYVQPTRLSLRPRRTPFHSLDFRVTKTSSSSLASVIYARTVTHTLSLFAISFFLCFAPFRFVFSFFLLRFNVCLRLWNFIFLVLTFHFFIPPFLASSFPDFSPRQPALLSVSYFLSLVSCL